jgi:hypothetical protein
MSHTNPAGPVSKQAGEPRQLIFLGLCSLALVLAAFAAPPTAQGAAPPDIPFGNWFGNQSEQVEECSVLLSEDPVPGREVTVTVRRGTTPVENAAVWFDDRSIGLTNESGRVDGTVPYVRSLEVTVGLPGGGSCEFGTGVGDRPGRSPAVASSAGNVQPGPAQSAPSSAGAFETALQVSEGPNVSTEYPISSVVDVGVRGQTNPGENVTVVAAIEGDPVPDATVLVDGETVGKTGGDGTYTLTVPDDGRESLTIVVQRGEIAGRTQVPVRLLRVAVQGERFPLPGQSATVEATVVSDPVEGAAVTVGDERIDTTDARGEAEIVLPADPLDRLTVTTGDRTAQRVLLTVYAPTIVSVAGVLVLLLGGPLVVYWAGGRRGLAVLFGFAANLVTGVAGYVVAGRDGAILAAGSLLLLIVLVIAVRRPALLRGLGDRVVTVLRPAGSGEDPLAAWIERVTDGVLWVTRRAEVAIDRLKAGVSRAVAHLRVFDVAAFATQLRAFVVAVPALVAAAAMFVVHAPRRLLGWMRPWADGDERTESTVDVGDHDRREETPGPAIRELWRRFARRVAPEHWPQRTPGEVSRRAIDAGFPRDSVVELTAVFRDVEYGGESLSETHYRRARNAFDSLGDGGETGNRADDDAGGVGDDGEVTES